MSELALGQGRKQSGPELPDLGVVVDVGDPGNGAFNAIFGAGLKRRSDDAVLRVTGRLTAPNFGEGDIKGPTGIGGRAPSLERRQLLFYLLGSEELDLLRCQSLQKLLAPTFLHPVSPCPSGSGQCVDKVAAQARRACDLDYFPPGMRLRKRMMEVVAHGRFIPTCQMELCTF